MVKYIMEVFKVKVSKMNVHKEGSSKTDVYVCVCVCTQCQGGVTVLYIAIVLLFLLMTVIAEMMVGGEFGGGCRGG